MNNDQNPMRVIYNNFRLIISLSYGYILYMLANYLKFTMIKKYAKNVLINAFILANRHNPNAKHNLLGLNRFLTFLILYFFNKDYHLQNLLMINIHNPKYIRNCKNSQIIRMIFLTQGNCCRFLSDDMKEKYYKLIIKFNPAHSEFFNNMSQDFLEKCVEYNYKSIFMIENQSKKMQSFALNKDLGTCAYLSQYNESLILEFYHKRKNNIYDARRIIEDILDNPKTIPSLFLLQYLYHYAPDLKIDCPSNDKLLDWYRYPHTKKIIQTNRNASLSKKRPCTLKTNNHSYSNAGGQALKYFSDIVIHVSRPEQMHIKEYIKLHPNWKDNASFILENLA